MSCCQYMLGSCRSQVSRLAAELMYAKGNMRAPPVAFDGAACRRFSTLYSVPLDWRSEFDVWVDDAAP